VLGSQFFAVYKSEYERTIDTLGVSMVFKHSKGGATANIVGGSRIAGDKDDGIIQSYGIGALIFTLKARDFPTTPPIKFDQITIGTETHVIDHVAPVHLNNSTFGYRCFVRGK
jgi:hypothetical protein